MEKRFLTVNEIAEILSVSRQTVANWVRRGKLPAFRTKGFAKKGDPKGPGRAKGVVRVAREDFEKFLEKYRTGERISRTS